MFLMANSMHTQYVREYEGVYRIGNTRVSLDSIVYLFREGMSAESMVDSYPALTLEQVHGALAFYLRNQKEIDAYLEKGRCEADLLHQQSRKTNADLIAKLQRARHASSSQWMEGARRVPQSRSGSTHLMPVNRIADR